MTAPGPTAEVLPTGAFDPELPVDSPESGHCGEGKRTVLGLIALLVLLGHPRPAQNAEGTDGRRLSADQEGADQTAL